MFGPELYDLRRFVEKKTPGVLTEGELIWHEYRLAHRSLDG